MNVFERIITFHELASPLFAAVAICTHLDCHHQHYAKYPQKYPQKMSTPRLPPPTLCIIFTKYPHLDKISTQNIHTPTISTQHYAKYPQNIHTWIAAIRLPPHQHNAKFPKNGKLSGATKLSHCTNGKYV